MKTDRIVQEFIQVTEQLGVRVRRERGQFKGGRCTVRGEDCILLNRHHSPEIHLSILANALRELPVETIFLRPRVRAALEDAWVDSPTDAFDSDDL